MNKTIELTQEEIDFLLSKYDNDLQVIQADIDVLLTKQASLMKRKAQLISNEDVEYSAIVPPIVLTKKSIQTDFFGNDFLDGYNTVRKKIGYIFSKYPGEYSTGEMYAKLVSNFPSEANKSKVSYVQGLSKELGKTPKLYRRNDDNKDDNGKSRFKYLG